MQNYPVDLRSDTVTKPNRKMREAIAEAEVGDDVFGEDPTVNELEATAAKLLGKEAAVLFPSGTQSNLAAILAHCQRGDEMLVGERYHSFHDEAGGASALGGIAYSTLPTNTDGSLSAHEIAAAVRPDDPHYPRTRLLCLENTTAGKAVTQERIKSAADAARNLKLKIHLDGARIFNAAQELGLAVSTIAAVADTVSVCLSKGLGAPAGTILASGRNLEEQIRRNRKILGGGMRQAGILAAAGLHALSYNISRLREDHRRARELARLLRDLTEKFGLGVTQHTNMVFVTPRESDHAALHKYLTEHGILIGNRRPAMRIVTHLGISDSDIERAASVFREYFRSH